MLFQLTLMHIVLQFIDMYYCIIKPEEKYDVAIEMTANPLIYVAMVRNSKERSDLSIKNNMDIHLQYTLACSLLMFLSNCCEIWYSLMELCNLTLQMTYTCKLIASSICLPNSYTITIQNLPQLPLYESLLLSSNELFC